MDFVFERQIAEYQESFASSPPDADDRAGAAIELLWTKLSGDTFYAWLELIVAARTEPVLLEKVQEVTRRFDKTAGAVREDMFPPPEDDNPYYKVAVAFAFATLIGLGVTRIYEADHRQRKVIEPLKMLARMVDSAGR